MVDDISCEIEPSDDPDERGELYCEVDGDRRHVSDLTKAQCQRTERGEWLQGYDRVQNWSGVTNPRKRRVIKRALRNGTNIVKSVSQQDDPPIKKSTAEHIQESYQPSVAGACRRGRDRAATQPNSYETSSTQDRSTETTTGEADNNPEWVDDTPDETDILKADEDEVDELVQDWYDGI